MNRAAPIVHTGIVVKPPILNALGHIPRRAVAGSRDNSVFSILRNRQTEFFLIEICIEIIMDSPEVVRNNTRIRRGSHHLPYSDFEFPIFTLSLIHI